MLREGDQRIPSGCAISGIMDRSGKGINGIDIIKSIELMHERSNGLGGGFAAYGIYPEYKDCYAFHLFYDDTECKEETERFIKKHFEIKEEGKIDVRKNIKITNSPIIWRYFLKPLEHKVEHFGLGEEEFVVRCVLRINTRIKGAFVFSSGKNMGVFKAVGYPEDVGDFFKLDEYKGYIWTAHGRFPTNTPGWWGGAHPFSLLNLSVVHNGELSSYGTNKRYLEEFGYQCTLQTDTEVIAYMFDLLIRKHKLPLDLACRVVAPPFHEQIQNMEPEMQKTFKAIRVVYGKALMNGPFSIILGTGKEMIALNDRIKLRSMVIAEKGDMLYAASEESAIRIVCPNPSKVYIPKGGEPIIGKLKTGVKTC